MNLAAYQTKIAAIGFVEFPTSISGVEMPISNIVNFDETDLDLKIYLTTMIIRRCFSATGSYSWPGDTIWLIENFLHNYETDLLKPWLTNTISDAFSMILSDE